MNKDDAIIETISNLLTLGIIIGLCFLGARWFSHWLHSRPTTYCTAWTRAVSITPTNHDNGKYADEQYIVKYANGSIDGQSQGDIPYARCTNKINTVKVPKPEWKKVDSFGDVDWEQ